MPPASIGPYTIESELGRGGMGVVYLATDTRLDRRVAIKALPQDLADPDRLARFQREAKVLASLSHPNIATIHGLERVGDDHFLVMELIEGSTLAARLEGGPLPVAEAIEIAAQIAAGLEAAHDKGIVHRDLKPGNVMVTPEGRVKVLDFGLARTGEGAPSSTSYRAAISDSPTLTRPMPMHSPTIPGVIMGTAGYMSPEQARGKAVDKRSDIFSFGCVLFEMLTGAQPFRGETVTDSLGAILHREPDWTLLPEATPALVRLTLKRCMEKDRAKRTHDIADTRIDLEAAAADPTAGGLLANRAQDRAEIAGRTRTRWVAAGLVAAALAIGGALGWSMNRPRASASPAPVVRFDVDPPAGFTLPQLGDGAASLCLNPAGDTIVFGARSEGESRLFIRELAAAEARAIPGTEGAGSPFFSPDGRWLGYSSGGRMMKVPIAGGPALTVCETGQTGALWLDDGTILFGGNTGVWRVSDGGGTPSLLAKVEAEAPAPGGKAPLLGFLRIERVPGAPYVLASTWDGDTLESYTVVAVSLADGAIRPVLQKATEARYIAPGYLIFLRESSVMAVAFDPVRGVVTGEPKLVIDGVRVTRWADVGYFATSLDGSMAYVPGDRLALGRRLVRVDQTGKSSPLTDGTDAIVGGTEVSPDGRSVALVTLRRRVEMWTYDLERQTMALVNNTGESYAPVWTPDGAAVLFERVLPGKPHEFVRKVLGGGPVEVLRKAADQGDLFPTSISPDGASVLMTLRPAALDAHDDIVLYRMGQDVPTEPVESGPTDEGMARFSPDGKFIAYCSQESGKIEVYARGFGEKAGTGQRVQVSTAGGHSPRWSRDGKRLFYIDRKGVMFSAAVETEGRLRVSPPVRLFELKGIATTSAWGVYDVLPDDSFVMIQPAEWEAAPSRIRVVLNWREELGGK